MLGSMFKKFKAQRERGYLIQQLAKSEDGADSIEEQARNIIKQEDGFNRQVLIVGLTGTTIVLHFYLGTALFTLNSLGYLALLAAHYAVPQRESYQRWTRDGLFGYTGFTVAGYFIVKGVGGWTSPIGIASKLAELGLMHVLWEDGKAAKNQPIVITEHEYEDMQVHIQNLSEPIAAV